MLHPAYGDHDWKSACGWAGGKYLAGNKRSRHFHCPCGVCPCLSPLLWSSFDILEYNRHQRSIASDRSRCEMRTFSFHQKFATDVAQFESMKLFSRRKTKQCECRNSTMHEDQCSDETERQQEEAKQRLARSCSRALDKSMSHADTHEPTFCDATSNTTDRTPQPVTNKYVFATAHQNLLLSRRTWTHRRPAPTSARSQTNSCHAATAGLVLPLTPGS